MVELTCELFALLKVKDILVQHLCIDGARGMTILQFDLNYKHGNCILLLNVRGKCTSIEDYGGGWCIICIIKLY